MTSFIVLLFGSPMIKIMTVKRAAARFNHFGCIINLLAHSFSALYL